MAVFFERNYSEQLGNISDCLCEAKFNFSQSQEILDTLIDVRNAKHQNTTSENQIKYTHNLAFRCKCSSPFHGTAASKIQLTTAHSQLYRS